MSLRNTLIAALVAGALGLAGCGGGGGGSSGGGDDAAAQRAAVAEAIGGARGAVDALADATSAALLDIARRAVSAARDAVAGADALSDAEKEAHLTTLAVIEDALDAAGTREIAGLRAALDGAPIAAVSPTVAHGAAPVLSGTVPGGPSVAGLATEAVAGTSVSAGG